MEAFDGKNVGLPTNFQMINGKFLLEGGTKKVDNNMTMLLSFIGFFRIFNQDYVIPAAFLYQNTTSFIFKFKNIFRLRVLGITKQYVPFADVYAVDVLMNRQIRKEIQLSIQYKYKLSEKAAFQTITKITT